MGIALRLTAGILQLVTQCAASFWAGRKEPSDMRHRALYLVFPLCCMLWERGSPPEVHDPQVPRATCDAHCATTCSWSCQARRAARQWKASARATRIDAV